MSVTFDRVVGLYAFDDDSSDCPEVRRYAGIEPVWERRMGDSWEPEWDFGELEEAYQKCLRGGK